MHKNRLLSIMRRELEYRQLQLSPYCIKQIEGLLNNGIKRMKMSNTLDHAGYVTQAERNLKALIEYFGKHAQNIGTFPELRDNDFDNALRACPTLWPFCTSG